MIAITLDLEWAPSPVIADTLELLDAYGVRATLFSTHDDGFDVTGHERALHPNFLREGQTEREALAEVAELYTEATGLRSHSLYVHSPLRSLYDEFGLAYESNYMMYRVPGISPFGMLPDVVQFPVYFMDDEWFRRESQGVPTAEELLHPEGLKVFDFHPPHIFYNTPSMEYYTEHKEEYWSESPDIDGIRYDGDGVRDVFVDLLEYLEANGYHPWTMSELEDTYRSQPGQKETVE